MSGIKIDFSATDAGFTSTVGKVNSSINGMEKNVARAGSSISMGFGSIMKAGAALGVGIAAVQGAFAAAAGTLSTFSDAISMGGKLAELKVQTGETAGNLLVLQRAFQNTGLESDAVGQSINKLQKFMAEAAMGSESQVDAMGRLGLTMNDLKGKTPTEQMGMFAEKISTIESPTARASFAMEIFGKSGGKMLPLLRNFSEELDGARGELGSLPGTMDRSAEAFDFLSDKMTVIKGKAVEVAAGFIEKALPALNIFAAKIAGFDATGWGSRLMDTVLRVADIMMGAFRNPLAAIDLIGAALLYSVKSFGNAMINGISNIASMIWPTFKAGFSTIANDFKSLMVEGAFKYLEFLTRGMVGAASILGGDIEKIAKNIGEPMQEGFRISAKLYGMEMNKANNKIQDDLAATMAKTRESTTDFFGAQGELDRLRVGTAKLEGDGAKWRNEVTKGAEDLQAHTKAAKEETDVIPQNFQKALGFADKIKEKMSASKNLFGKLDDTIAKNAVDPRGRLEAKANAQMQAGNFIGARHSIEKIRDNEDRTRINEMLGLKQGERMSVRDMAKRAGMDTNGKSNKQLLAGLAGLGKQNLKADPSLELIRDIKALLTKIEPKLPMHALN